MLFLVFLLCKYGNFPLFYNYALHSLKILAINFFFWILPLVHMIAIHHCAKEQLACLNCVQIRASYWTCRLSDWTLGGSNNFNNTLIQVRLGGAMYYYAWKATMNKLCFRVNIWALYRTFVK